MRHETQVAVAAPSDRAVAVALRSRPLVATLLAGLLLGMACPPVLAQVSRRSAIVDAVAKTRDAIVNLRTLRVVPARFEGGNGGRVRGLGTGVLIDARGYVVTNYHVVEDTDEVAAETADGRHFGARVLRFDKRNDIAVLKLDSAEPFAYLPLYGAGDAMLGETVIAIGNPYGLENSVTTGIVSSVQRRLKLPNGEVFDGLIQTDASINPGNSGGPLLTIDGQLLGVNVAIRTEAQGICFAIPTSEVRRIVGEVMGRPPVDIAQYGLKLEPESPLELASVQDEAPQQLPRLRIANVTEGSVADSIGFATGDVLLALGDQDIRTPFDLDRLLWDRKPGDALDFRVQRSNERVETLRLRLEQPEARSDAEIVWQYFGVKTKPVAADVVRRVYAPLNGGLLLTKVSPGSPAEKAGFREGDILVGLHDWETIDPNNIRYVMQWKELAQNQPIGYHLVRDGSLKTGTLRMPHYAAP